jgi:hypothetical protein
MAVRAANGGVEVPDGAAPGTDPGTTPRVAPPSAAAGRVSERIHLVLLRSRGSSLAQIAALYQIDERTVLRSCLPRTARLKPVR